MKKSERLNLIQGLVSSTVESVSIYEEIENRGVTPNVGYPLSINDSKESILRRCMLIRAEVLKLMQSFK